MSEKIQFEQRFSYQGFELEYANAGIGTNILSVRLMPGNLIFEKRNLVIPNSLWKTGNEYHLKDPFTIYFPNNDTQNGILHSVYIVPNYGRRFYNTNIYSVDIKLSNGISDETIPFPEIIPQAAFVGLVYVPSLYPIVNDRIYFRSVNKIFTQSNFSNDSGIWYKNLTESVEVWRTLTLYLNNQIVRVGNRLWLCIKTHASSNSFLADESTKLFWIPLTGGSEGGDSCCDDMFIDEEETNCGISYIITYMRVKQENGTIVNKAISSRMKIY